MRDSKDRTTVITIFKRKVNEWINGFRLIGIRTGCQV